ncbi:BCD family MFS transporter [Pannus brasiliensis CCIBt3594]|uniref:BCD family MFS transporter n=1 Tax=Pannus brasiliensis CCIBt3594 TaxID=1427578 RepID=A0AAW9QYD1_9CHRO
MATSDIPNPAHLSEKPLPKLKLLTMFRLGLFQMGLGIMSLLTLGVLNRIMIDELKVIPFLAAAAIAMHQFVSPARVWFGQMSDARPLFGRHRSGYVWIGAALFTGLAFIALQTVWQLGISIQTSGWSPVTYAWTAAVAAVFALYGLALSASSTPFAALLVDVSDEENRSKLVGIVWSMLMVGIVVGAIVSSRLLDSPNICGAEILTYDPTRSAPVADIAKLQATINPVFTLMPAIVFGLCILSTFGIEKKYSRFSLRSNQIEREDQITIKHALGVLTASRQTGLFFTFLLVMTVSLFMQDAVMEPYGGEVFGMCIAETTKLNAFWGSGTLFGIASTGFFLVPRVGKQKATKFGLIFAAICLILLIFAGFSANQSLLKSGLLFFGLASGTITAGATSLMLDLTAAETAGTFIGAWGLSQAIARGLATVLGGTVLNIGKAMFSLPALSYGLVFFLQAVGMLVAVWLLGRVDIKEFKENARAAIATVMRGEID